MWWCWPLRWCRPGNEIRFGSAEIHAARIPRDIEVQRRIAAHSLASRPVSLKAGRLAHNARPTQAGNCAKKKSKWQKCADSCVFDRTIRLYLASNEERRKTNLKLLKMDNLYGGGRGIRTPGTLSGTTVFKTAGINRSPIPPRGGNFTCFISLPQAHLMSLFAGVAHWLHTRLRRSSQ